MNGGCNIDASKNGEEHGRILDTSRNVRHFGSGMKRKIGTVVDDALYRDVKMLAAREGRAIADVVACALSDYTKRSRGSQGGKAGLARLLQRPPLGVNDEQFREGVELDYFDQ